MNKGIPILLIVLVAFSIRLGARPDNSAKSSQASRGSSEGAPNGSSVGSETPKIITWAGNTGTWNQKLHVSGYRLGCSDDAVACVDRGLTAVAREGIRNIFLSMPMDESTMARNALAYSLLSVDHPSLVEVGFDDFVDRYGILSSRDSGAATLLETVVGDVKSKNPTLNFGITLYEDELDSPFARPPKLPRAVADAVGYVHLYIHYRMDAKNYPRYVQEAKALFPHAKIIAGSYAYDRIDYIPCSPSGRKACSPTEELELYKQSIQIQAHLLATGDVDGIEFFPGFFGVLQKWQGWKNPEYCAPARRQECIKNTEAMRDAALDALRSALGW